MRKKILVLVLIIILSFGSIVSIEVDTAQAVLPLILAPESVSIAGSLLVSAGLTFASNPAMYSAITSFAYRYAPAWSEISQLAGTVGVGQSVAVTGTIANALNDFVNKVMPGAISFPSESISYSFQSNTLVIGPNQEVFVPVGSSFILTYSDGLQHNLRFEYYNNDTYRSSAGAQPWPHNAKYDFVASGLSMYVYVNDEYNTFITSCNRVKIVNFNTDISVNLQGVSSTVDGSALLGVDTTLDSSQSLKDLTGAFVNIADGTTLLNKTASDIGVQLATQTSILDDVRTGIRSLVDALSLTVPLDLSPLSVNADVLSTKFPFSLPWDLKNSLEVLNVTGEFQPFTVTFYNPLSTILPGVDPHIAFTIDPKPFIDILVPIVRAGYLILFGIGLILITPKLFGGSS